MNLKGKTIAVGVTGGIAAYKTCEVVSRLVKAGADVHVVMTKHATEFVGLLTFQTLSRNRVICDMFDQNFQWEVEHISLAKKADLFLIAPASANFLGKYACGIADDFLSTTIMAATCPVLLAPAMNSHMLASAAVQQNMATLRARGCFFIESGTGMLACGDEGKGRMAEPNELVHAVCDIFSIQQDYQGKTVMITAGATEEPIDPVRFITNRSSGKMGLALAREAANRGAEVILVAGLLSQPINGNYSVIHVKTTQEMLEAVIKYLPQADVIIKAAAPSDYAVLQQSAQKIKADQLTLQLKKNPDIAKAVGEQKGNKKLVIFSAETENLIENALKKLKNKRADMVVANDVTMPGAGFNSDTNLVTIITEKSQKSYEVMSKSAVAREILNQVLTLS